MQRIEYMTEYNFFYYSYASFTNGQLPPLKVAALYFNKLVLPEDSGILEIVTPATVLAEYEARIAAAIRRDMGDRECLELCENQNLYSGEILTMETFFFHHINR